ADPHAGRGADAGARPRFQDAGDRWARAARAGLLTVPATLPSDGPTFLRERRDGLARLPVTFRAFLGVEAGKWPALFAPEKARLVVLAEVLTQPATAEVLAGVARLEVEAGCGDVRE